MGDGKMIVHTFRAGRGGDWVRDRYLKHVQQCRDDVFKVMAVPEEMVRVGGDVWPEKITMTYEQFYNRYGGYPSEFGIGDV